MAHTARSLVATAAVVLLAAGCGDITARPADGGAPPATSASTTSVAPTTPAPDGTRPPTVDPDDGLAGFGPPAAAAGEFDLHATWAIVGTATLDQRGCWWVANAGERGLLIAPTGTELGETGETLVLDDGTVIEDGARLEVDGVVLYGVDDLPGGPDGQWGNYATFCDPGRPVVVAKALAIADDTDVSAAAADLASIGAALFGTDHGCGYGFATGSADDRWALEIHPMIGDPIDPGTIVLPDDRFVATVTVGQHLFSNHCDDVDEWFEPDRVAAATWPIVAGTFAHPGGDGTGNCDQGSITTTLDGIVVDVDGVLVELDPVTIVNRSFGCFAG